MVKVIQSFSIPPDLIARIWIGINFDPFRDDSEKISVKRYWQCRKHLEDGDPKVKALGAKVFSSGGIVLGIGIELASQCLYEESQSIDLKYLNDKSREVKPVLEHFFNQFDIDLPVGIWFHVAPWEN